MSVIRPLSLASVLAMAIGSLACDQGITVVVDAGDPDVTRDTGSDDTGGDTGDAAEDAPVDSGDDATDGDVSDTSDTEDVLSDPIGDAPQDTADVMADGSDVGEDVGGDVDGGSDADMDTASDVDATVDTDTDPDCDEGTVCRPFVVDTFPYVHDHSTIGAPSDSFDAYACSPATNESGPEVIYRVDVPSAGFLRAAIDDVSGDDADVDIHLLSDVDAAACLMRDNVAIARYVEAGTYYIVIDTWVNGSGTELAADYTLNVTHVGLDAGPCAMQAVDQEMFWTSCDANIDCYTDGGDTFLRTPAYGPVVMEAHLVTVDDGFGAGWPTSANDGLAAHYALSEAATGFVTTRNQVWAPAGEGGSEWGQGSTGRPLPVDAEAWYINMYWRNRPAAGTRVLVINPANGRAVVAAGGYETGPGANTAIGGAVEEVHRHLGTGHRDDLVMGFLVDTNLPYGPIDCE